MVRRRMWVAAVLLIALSAAAAAITWPRVRGPDEERTLAGLRKVDDFPLYLMHYYGDYGFKESLQERRGASSQSQATATQSPGQWACTCFAGLSPEADRVFGRNFDWTTQAALLLFTDPPDGYASVSMVDITYLGFAQSEPDAEQRLRLLQAPFMPFDGMNEKGVAVGMMAVEGQVSSDVQKTTIDSLEAIRLLLDYASDVPEAVGLLQQYNVDFGDGPPVHYLIADVTGQSVTVEYVQGEMKVIPNADPWQVATNFVVWTVNPQGAQSPCWRYNAVWEALERGDGNLSLDEALSLLQQVSQGGSSSTRWSVVYDMTSGDVHIAMGRQYQQVHEFELPMAR